METICSTNEYKVLSNNEPDDHKHEVAECPVCYCTDKSLGSAFQCSHILCDECVGQIINVCNKKRCPICRSNVKQQPLPQPQLSKWDNMNKMMIAKEIVLTSMPGAYPLIHKINKFIYAYTVMKKTPFWHTSELYCNSMTDLQKEAEKFQQKFYLASTMKQKVLYAEKSNSAYSRESAIREYVENYLDIFEYEFVLKSYNFDRQNARNVYNKSIDLYQQAHRDRLKLIINNPDAEYPELIEMYERKKEVEYKCKAYALVESILNNAYKKAERKANPSFFSWLF